MLRHNTTSHRKHTKGTRMGPQINDTHLPIWSASNLEQSVRSRRYFWGLKEVTNYHASFRR